ncbi:MAG TPA: hypothetical protein PK829_10420 [Promineifilum sp.]|nr:hypothetical protein [Promineifilum sp.]
MAERFIADLNAAAAAVRASLAAKGSMAPVYGLATALPFRGSGSDILKRSVDRLYKV